MLFRAKSLSNPSRSKAHNSKRHRIDEFGGDTDELRSTKIVVHIVLLYEPYREGLNNRNRLEDIPPNYLLNILCHYSNQKGHKYCFQSSSLQNFNHLKHKPLKLS